MRKILLGIAIATGLLFYSRTLVAQEIDTTYFLFKTSVTALSARDMGTQITGELLELDSLLKHNAISLKHALVRNGQICVSLASYYDSIEEILRSDSFMRVMKPIVLERKANTHSAWERAQYMREYRSAVQWLEYFDDINVLVVSVTYKINLLIKEQNKRIH